ncbi:MAG: RNA methyltransferase [Dehalococcoidia bacterium]|nr:RNA methyltransferase [Dehalococcoidia bacterium]
MSQWSDSNADSPKSMKRYRNLATRKGRMKAGAFLVEGERAITQIAVNRPDAVLEIVSTTDPPHRLDEYPVRIVTERQMESISSIRTPQGIIAVIELPRDTYSDQLPEHVGGRVLLLEDVQDPGNVGTLIRTAAALDYSGILLSDNCADPLSPKCVQSSAGAVLSLWSRRTPCYLEHVAELKRQGYFLVAADLEGESDPTALLGRENLVLALGNEGAGLSSRLLRLADFRLRVATVRQKAESLNVAACGAICMYLSCQA